jgi:hypothetical protein
MKIAIMGSGIEVFCCAHRLLDLDSKLEIHIFDEKAEAGMYGEEPGIFQKWPITPTSWYGKMFSQAPNKKSTAVRYSWFVKSLSIALAKRGATHHLKTRVTDIRNNEVKYIGAGHLGSGVMKVQQIIDLRENKSGKKWHGAISKTTIEGKICGIRPDETVENWSSEEVKGNFIQKMNWYGEDPEKAISNRVLSGIEAAELTII